MDVGEVTLITYGVSSGKQGGRMERVKVWFDWFFQWIHESLERLGGVSDDGRTD